MGDSRFHAHACELVKLFEETAALFLDREPEPAARRGISHAEYRALRFLTASPRSPIQALARAIGITKSGATRVLDRLERRGLARRERDPADGRVCCVVPTGAGKTFLQTCCEEQIGRVERILAGLGGEMAVILTAALRSFLDAARSAAADDRI